MTAPSDVGAPRPAAKRGHLGSVVRRGWLPVALGLVLGILAGLLVHKLVTVKYSASASVLVTPTGVNESPTLVGGRTNSDVINMDTEVQLVTSDNVAKRVQQNDSATRSTSLSDLIKPVTVTVAANTEVMMIAYQADTAASSARLANDFATAYLQQRQSDAQAMITAQLDKITPQAGSLSGQLRTLSEKLDQLTGKSPQISFVRAQVASLKSRVNSLNSRISSLSTTVVTPGQIRSTATPAAAKASPSRLLFVAAGAAIGLLLGLLVAWLRVTVRRRLRDADDVRSTLDLPVLATVGGSSGDTAADARSFQSYRRLANIIAAAGGNGSRTVLVTGQRAGSTGAVASNLLRAFALSGTPTVLMPTSRATVETLGKDRKVRDALVPAPANGVFGADELAEARGSGYLIAAATDPRMSADAQTIARFSDAAVIVVDKSTRTRVAEEILEQLDAVGAPVLGVVLVRSRRLMHKAEGNTTSEGKSDGSADQGDNAADSSADTSADTATDTATDDARSTASARDRSRSASTSTTRSPATTGTSRRKQ